MTCRLLHASYSLREWQAKKLTFFAPGEEKGWEKITFHEVECKDFSYTAAVLITKYWAQEKYNDLIFFPLKGFLNEVFVIRYSVNQGLGKCYQPQLITIILDITKSEFGNIYRLIIHYLIATIHCDIKHNLLLLKQTLFSSPARVHWFPD